MTSNPQTSTPATTAEAVDQAGQAVRDLLWECAEELHLPTALTWLDRQLSRRQHCNARALFVVLCSAALFAALMIY